MAKGGRKNFSNGSSSLNNRSNEVVHQIFYDCLNYIDEDDPWYEYFENAAFGNLPWGIKFSNNRIIYKKTKNSRAIYINLDDTDDFYETIDTVKKYFSYFIGNLEKSSRVKSTKPTKINKVELPHLLKNFAENLIADTFISKLIFEHLRFYYLYGGFRIRDIDFSVEKIDFKVDDYRYATKVFKHIRNIENVRIVTSDDVQAALNEDLSLEQILDTYPQAYYLLDSSLNIIRGAVIQIGNENIDVIPNSNIISCFEDLISRDHSKSDFSDMTVPIDAQSNDCFSNIDFLRDYLDKNISEKDLNYIASKNLKFWNSYLRKMVRV